MDSPPPFRGDSFSDVSRSNPKVGERSPLDPTFARSPMEQFGRTGRPHLEEGDSSGIWNSNKQILPPNRAELEEAAAFALPRMRRSQRGLEVRSLAVRYVFLSI